MSTVLNVINVVIIVNKFQKTISFRRARYFTDYIIMINNNTIRWPLWKPTRLRLLYYIYYYIDGVIIIGPPGALCITHIQTIACIIIYHIIL